MNGNKLANKLQIQDLSIETQSLSDSSTIIGADSCSGSTFCSYGYSYSYSYSYNYNYSYSYSSSFSTSYDCNQPGNQAPEEETTYVAYSLATGYNPWRKR